MQHLSSTPPFAVPGFYLPAMPLRLIHPWIGRGCKRSRWLPANNLRERPPFWPTAASHLQQASYSSIQSSPAACAGGVAHPVKRLPASVNARFPPFLPTVLAMPAD
jgi:hypothetical protein